MWKQNSSKQYVGLVLRQFDCPKEDRYLNIILPPVKKDYNPTQGRFPANLLVSDDVLNDGQIRKSGLMKQHINGGQFNVYGKQYPRNVETIGDSGSFSRFFDLDAWFTEQVKQLPESVQKTFPFLLVPKASKREKNEGCEGLDNETYLDESKLDKEAIGCNNPRNRSGEPRSGNNHPTCKPLKLMSYLITLGSRENEIVCDPFLGSGTTAIAAISLGRRCIGFEISPEYTKIANARIARAMQQTKLNLY